MFYACENLVGGKGTAYNEDYTDLTYAHIDGGAADPGYLTAVGEIATGINGMNNGQMTNDELQMTNAGVVFDLSGKRVGHSTFYILHSHKGLYIVNGKTVLMK